MDVLHDERGDPASAVPDREDLRSGLSPVLNRRQIPTETAQATMSGFCIRH
jgi:hypothetical protein